MGEGLQPGKMGEGLQPGEEGLFGICKYRQANTWLHSTPDGGSLQSSMGTLVLHEWTQNWISDRAVKVGVALSFSLRAMQAQCRYAPTWVLLTWGLLPVTYIFQQRRPRLEWFTGT